MDLDKKLKETEYMKQESWGKILNMLKRQFDQWAIARLSDHGYRDFKMAYMSVLMNISTDGTNNNDLARVAKVSKQAMSKVARELQEQGYIRTKVDAKDKRSTIFLLTSRGKKLVLQARLSVKELMDEYRRNLGKAKFDQAMRTLLEIIEYTDDKLIRDMEK